MSRCGCPSESVRRRGSDPCPLKEKDPQLRESHRAQPVSPRCRECWGAAVDCQTVGRDDSSARRPIRTGLDEATHTPEQSVLSRVGHTMTAARPDWLTYLFRPRRRRRSRNSHAACTAFLLRAKSSWAARMLSLADFEAASRILRIPACSSNQPCGLPAESLLVRKLELRVGCHVSRHVHQQCRQHQYPSDAELGAVAAIDDHPRYVVLGPS